MFLIYSLCAGDHMSLHTHTRTGVHAHTSRTYYMMASITVVPNRADWVNQGQCPHVAKTSRQVGLR